jgi:NhaP-type Na+/H+ or K+/H+ antiporter
VSTTETTTEVRVRRAPRLPVFLVLGAVVGAILTLIATATIGHVDPKVGFGATFGYFCVFGVPAGIALGALVGLLLDRRSQRRARVVSAEYELVESPPAETSGPSD